MIKQKMLLGLVSAAFLGMGSLPGAAEAADNPFASVPPDSGYYDDVDALVNNGLIYGYEKGEFKKTRIISRMEMAIFTAKAMSAMDRAGAEDTQRIQRLMQEFSGELTDMHVKLPGVKAKTDEAKAAPKGPKIKQMPKNFSLTGLIRLRDDWGHSENDKKEKNYSTFGGTKNHQLLWQLFTKFDIAAGWTGEIDFLGAKDGDGDSRTTGENTSGTADVNKAFVTGPLAGGSVRIGRVKGSTVYGDSMIMGQYYQGIDYTRKMGKWKAGATWGKVDYNTSSWSGDDGKINTTYSDKAGSAYGYKAERGVSGSDMNPDGLGVNMTQIQTSYQASKDFAWNMGFWHLTARGSGDYRSGKDIAFAKSDLAALRAKAKTSHYNDPNIFETSVSWQASRKLKVLGNFAISDDTRGKNSDHGRQNKAYGISFRWGQVAASNPHSSKLQLDLLHQERYTGIKSTYDLKNKSGEGQRGFILDYRYVPIQNVMFDFRWMHYHSLGKTSTDMDHGNQYRVQAYYYF
ncbi:S-layer homology domain-containing protein [Selenomonas ruminantium]|uniref:S-layer homology domain-containing protein n=1 Tax=Selenomonas ruminantium TaxID=971 RepID=A0A1M6TCP0_SELRU|nr:S-layer homology domain-containing protein [Selenomonas ruminantium]SHK54741.1 S-layer homology domain-containing protein [Selenomonas ruminantium]